MGICTCTPPHKFTHTWTYNIENYICINTHIYMYVHKHICIDFTYFCNYIYMFMLIFLIPVQHAECILVFPLSVFVTFFSKARRNPASHIVNIVTLLLKLEYMVHSMKIANSYHFEKKQTYKLESISIYSVLEWNAHISSAQFNNILMNVQINTPCSFWGQVSHSFYYCYSVYNVSSLFWMSAVDYDKP